MRTTFRSRHERRGRRASKRVLRLNQLGAGTVRRRAVWELCGGSGVVGHAPRLKATSSTKEVNPVSVRDGDWLMLSLIERGCPGRTMKATALRARIAL